MCVCGKGGGGRGRDAGWGLCVESPYDYCDTYVRGRRARHYELEVAKACVKSVENHPVTLLEKPFVRNPRKQT